MRGVHMRREISEHELAQRIKLNHDRLLAPYYQIAQVFDKGSSWPGDKAGRALLAFVSHYKISAEKIPCMEQMIEEIPTATNQHMFFGEPTGDVIFEQQLSGHSWYLRGLCEYYEQFADERVLHYMDETVKQLYLPTIGRFAEYPIEREQDCGGVSGHSYEEMHGWKLSTDIGCAFMCLDGLSHYYKLTGNQEVKALIEEMAYCFDQIDKFRLQAQTHCTLTAARGFMRMYEVTGESGYLEKAERIFWLYVEKGMTYTYQNFNWFGKGDTWTEPCAIIDSLMLAILLYQAVGKEVYRRYASQIYFNGFATLQRPNGGAGTDTTVSAQTHILTVDSYEAPFCCTMRLAEGLWFISMVKDLLYAEQTGQIQKDEHGCYYDGDVLYAGIPEKFEHYAEEPVWIDGHKLFPLLHLYQLQDEAECRELKQQIVYA